MKCNKCEYYYESIISFLDCKNVETDLGTRLVQCVKKKQELIDTGKGTVGLGDYTNIKCNKTCNIGIIKIFDCPKELKILAVYNIENNKEILTPDWCPKKTYNGYILDRF